VAGAVDWDLEKVQDEAYQREYKRQQAEQQQQAAAQSSRGPVCGVAFEIIAILFGAFAGPLAFVSFFPLFSESLWNVAQVSPMSPAPMLFASLPVLCC
jgi:hypothetical protein